MADQEPIMRLSLLDMASGGLIHFLGNWAQCYHAPGSMTCCLLFPTQYGWQGIQSGVISWSSLNITAHPAFKVQ